MRVILLDEARAELRSLPKNERRAMWNALDKLEAAGPLLAFPHSSQIKIEPELRELRPRQGHSPWRGIYRRLGDQIVVAAIGPEAEHDSRGFGRAVTAAKARLDEWWKVHEHDSGSQDS